MIEISCFTLDSFLEGGLMLGVYIRIINVLSFHEYKYRSDIAEEAKVSGGTINFYLSQLVSWRYIESKKDEPSGKLFFSKCRYKLTKKGLVRKGELKKNPISYINELIPEPN